jgi:glycosyltransferase involved in cell wall biosynthesis
MIGQTRRVTAAARSDGRGVSSPAGKRGIAPARPVDQRRARVLHVISTLLRGGTEMAMLHLIRTLDPVRYEFRVAYLRGEPVLGAEVEGAIGAPLVSIGLRRKIDPVALLRLISYVRRERIDLVHTHMDLADYYGAAAARLGGARGVVSTRHNADEFRMRRTWKRYPFLLLERLSYEAADRVVGVSQGVVDFLAASEYLPRRKMMVIPNGVEPALLEHPPDRAAARARSKLPPFQPLLGCVGRLEPQKGHTYLLQALPALLATRPGAGLVIAGDGPLRAELEAEARRLGIADRVHFPGYHHDVPALLAALDLFVLPSLWEGLSKALLEAMAVGCPIVASRAVGVTEVLRDGEEGILVPLRDAGALAGAMERALGDPGLAGRLGRAARQRVIEHYSMRTVGSAFDQLYREILTWKR